MIPFLCPTWWTLSRDKCYLRNQILYHTAPVHIREQWDDEDIYDEDTDNDDGGDDDDDGDDDDGAYESWWNKTLRR